MVIEERSGPQLKEVIFLKRVAVIGGGPSGISAAIWAKRLGLEPMMFERDAEIGGQLRSITLMIPDIPGHPAVDPVDLTDSLGKHLHQLGIPIFTNQFVMEYKNGEISCKDGTSYRIDHVIYGPGLKTRVLDVPGTGLISKESVSEILKASKKPKRVLVVGGGDRALEAAVRLQNGGIQTILVHRRDRFRARAAFQNQLQQTACDVVFSAQVMRIEQKNHALRVTVQRATGEIVPLDVDLVLVRIGMEPDIVLGLCPEWQQGLVPLNSSNGIRNVGDAVTATPYRSVVEAFASGMKAAKDLVMTDLDRHKL